MKQPMQGVKGYLIPDTQSSLGCLPPSRIHTHNNITEMDDTGIRIALPIRKSENVGNRILAGIFAVEISDTTIVGEHQVYRCAHLPAALVGAAKNLLQLCSRGRIAFAPILNSEDQRRRRGPSLSWPGYLTRLWNMLVRTRKKASSARPRSVSVKPEASNCLSRRRCIRIS